MLKDYDHKGNLMSISISLTNNNIFVILSISLTEKVWYIHSGKCVQIHMGHKSDIDSVLKIVQNPYTILLESTEKN